MATVAQSISSLGRHSNDFDYVYHILADVSRTARSAGRGVLFSMVDHGCLLQFVFGLIPLL
jgi:hypothetical protein